MSRYYFLGCALPDLSLDKPLEITIDELDAMLEMNLSEWDKDKLKAIKLLNDLNNLKAFLLNEPIQLNGNFDATELEDVLLAKEDVPEFAVDFLSKYDGNDERLRYFAELLANFFRWTQNEFKGFLAKYFDFERKMRLAVTAIRAKKFNRNLEQEFQFEDLSDPFVAYLLSQKDMDTIEPEDEFRKLLDIYNDNLGKPLELNTAIIEWKLEQIYEIVKEYPFEIDEILGYYIRLMLVENWHKLNKRDNIDIVDQLARE